MQFVFARNHSVIRKAWEENAEILSPDIMIEIADKDLTPRIRRIFLGTCEHLSRYSSTEGRLTFNEARAINYSKVTWPMLDAEIPPAEAIALLDKTLTDYEIAETEKKKREEEVRQEREEKKRQAEEERQREEEENEQKKAALKAWSIANGSDFLKARIEEGFSWQSQARQEFFGNYLPEGWEDGEDYKSWKDRTVPEMAEIQALRQARKDFSQSPYSNPRLVLATPNHAHDDDCYDDEDPCTLAEPEPVPALVVDIVTPDSEAFPIVKRF